jgi:hypothetical protein
MSCGWNGALATLYVEPGDSPHTFDTSSERWEFLSESLKASRTLINSNAISGTRSQRSDRTRTGPYTVAGAIDFECSPQWFDLWLPRILGAAEATDVFAVAETLPSFGVRIQRGGGVNTSTYLDCKVNRGTIKGQSGGVCMATVDIVGKTTTGGLAVPAVAVGSTAAFTPYVFTDCVFNIDSTPFPISSFELTVDNVIASIFNNSLSATCLRETDRIVSFRFNSPATDDFWDAVFADNNLELSLAMTNGSRSCTIDVVNLQPSIEDATVSGKTEVRWDISGIARATASVKEIIVTNDNT